MSFIEFQTSCIFRHNAVSISSEVLFGAVMPTSLLQIMSFQVSSQVTLVANIVKPHPPIALSSLFHIISMISERVNVLIQKTKSFPIKTTAKITVTVYNFRGGVGR